ncbi:MAG: hypothetical protein Q4C91_04435 [Eubacteriales bacterium]|nr:hypothetical protein [Eubacteriales bacterium]
MAGEILSGIVGLIFLCGAVMQFRCRGPIWTLEFIVAAPAERKRMQTRKAYFLTASACLLIGLSFLMNTVYSLTEIKIFLYIMFVLAALLFLVIVYSIIRSVQRSTEREPKETQRKRRKENKKE